jgi:hypothetical protein
VHLGTHTATNRHLPTHAVGRRHATTHRPPSSHTGGLFADLLQAALGACAIGMLYFKRQRERPKRPFKVWAFDAGKQGIGAGVAHVVNMLLSMLLSGSSHDDTPDECAFYFINFTFDTTIGEDRP